VNAGYKDGFFFIKMDHQTEYIAALISLHGGLERQGPGDRSLSLQILRSLKNLPSKPRIADLGCGTGAGALLLAEYFGSPVLAVDSASAFVEELRMHAKARGLDHLITAIEADMGNLNRRDASIDLLWSEGAAYNLGFEHAMHLWRPLLVTGGNAVVSEMSWFSGQIPTSALEFWQAAYPAIGSESENRIRAEKAGFKVLAMHRLPSEAWWASYYSPLIKRIEEIRTAANPIMRSVIQEIESEMNLFRQFSDFYGYTFYVLEAV